MNTNDALDHPLDARLPLTVVGFFLRCRRRLHALCQYGFDLMRSGVIRFPSLIEPLTCIARRSLALMILSSCRRRGQVIVAAIVIPVQNWRSSCQRRVR